MRQCMDPFGRGRCDPDNAAANSPDCGRATAGSGACGLAALASAGMTDRAAQFERDGYFVLVGALNRSRVESVREAAHRLAAEHDHEREQAVFRTDDADRDRGELFFASARGVQGFLEADATDESGALVVARRHSLNKIGHALHDFVPEIGDLCRQPLVRDAFRAAGHLQTEVVQSMLIFKPPSIGGEVRWHQDASYLKSVPHSVVGLWIALEDADRTNGCLWVSPGGHRSPLREDYSVDWQSRQGELRVVDDTPWPADGVPLEVPAGSIVVFHDHLPHRSDRNRSARSRLALTVHGYDSRSAWAGDNWLQRGAMSPFVV